MDHQVIVVDEDTQCLQAIGFALRSMGYLVNLHNNASMAAKDFKESSTNNYDLLIIDLRTLLNSYAKMSDLERESLLRIKTMGLNGFLDPISPEVLTKLGIHTCLSKPFDHHELTETLNKII